MVTNAVEWSSPIPVEFMTLIISSSTGSLKNRCLLVTMINVLKDEWPPVIKEMILFRLLQ